VLADFLGSDIGKTWAKLLEGKSVEIGMNANLKKASRHGGKRTHRAQFIRRFGGKGNEYFLEKGAEREVTSRNFRKIVPGTRGF